MAVDYLPSFVKYLYISSDHLDTVVLKVFLLVCKRFYYIKDVSLLSYELQMFSHLSNVLTLFMVFFSEVAKVINVFLYGLWLWFMLRNFSPRIHK